MSTTGGNDIESSNVPSNFGAHGLTSSHRGAQSFTSGEYTSSGSEIITPAYPLYYKMNHTKRGLALIFNHELFASDYMDPRHGTNVDCDALMTSLTQLGFSVRDYQNLNFKAITTVLAEVAEMDHMDHDCLVVAVLTHGGPGILYAYNIPYRTDIIWSYFTAKNCPSLSKKPKIFFIQACRGDELDDGTTLRERTASDGPKEQPTCRIRPDADFLIAHSNVPGFMSWRNEKTGTWFIQALCEKLNEYGTKQDLLTILTFVCQRVAIDFESKSTVSYYHKKKQIPCITSMLKYLVLFTPPRKEVVAEL